MWRKARTEAVVKAIVAAATRNSVVKVMFTVIVIIFSIFMMSGSVEIGQDLRTLFCCHPLLMRMKMMISFLVRRIDKYSVSLVGRPENNLFSLHWIGHNRIACLY